MVKIEVVYLDEKVQWIQSFMLPAETSIAEAFILMHLADHIPSLADLSFGIFGKIKKDGYILQEGDRLEIYRPLLIDPKDQRKKRSRS